MPITLIHPLAIGNAVRVFITPPAGAVAWKLLRKTVATFSAHNDPAASVISYGSDRVVMDATALINGTVYYYQTYWFDGAAWHAETVTSITPSPSFQPIAVDVMEFLRERLDMGLSVVLARGGLRHPKNHIQVLLAPPTFEDVDWPVVTLHLSSESAEVRGIGERVGLDIQEPITGAWKDIEGWLGRTQIAIVGWSLNPDERSALRKAIKSVVIANLTVFDGAGMLEVDFQQNDIEDFASFNAPVYQTMGSFSCIAPAQVAGDTRSISDIVLTINP